MDFPFRDNLIGYMVENWDIEIYRESDPMIPVLWALGHPRPLLVERIFRTPRFINSIHVGLDSV